jgi:hypothetical protein
MFKKIFILSLMIVLTNCAPPGSALLGPSITVARTGNLYQAGLSYGSSKVIKKTRESIQKIKETKKIVYQQIDQLHKKIEKDKINKAALQNQANLFFKTVKDNLKNYN